MLNAQKTTDLVQELRQVADKLDRAVAQDDSLAEQVLDFERGLVSLPELTAMAREIVEEIG